MSGGVDSSVAAALLKKAGYDLTGVYMKNWSGDDYGLQSDCPWQDEQYDVERVCKILEIPFRSINLEKEYREKVVEYFFREYQAGRTPNPDVMCNKEIKFGIFLQKAMATGAEKIATGHYASVEFNSETNEFQLFKGIDTNKDQSYFLNELGQDELAQTLFPLGKYTKPEVRTLASEFKLPTAYKPDSQGICFIGKIRVADFLRARIEPHKGEIRDIATDKIVGNHDGIEFFTIGQREGLGIGGSALPYFVCKKDRIKNILYVAPGTDHPALFARKVKFIDLHQINQEDISKLNLTAAIRYRQKPAAGKIDLAKQTFTFNEPQRAISAGQSIVFYDGERCLGGGIIE